MKKYSVSLRAISLIVVASFIGEQLAFAAPAVNPSKLDLFSKPKIDLGIPVSVAAIEDAWFRDGGWGMRDQKKNKTIYLIQDAHTNFSGQLNVARTLEHLFNSSLTTHPSSLKYVFLEAGSGDESLSFLRKYADLRERQRISESFLRQAKLQGSEYFDLTSNQAFVLWGVEDLPLYAKSVEAYREVVKDREKFQAYLRKVEMAVEALKPRIYNPMLLSFDGEYCRFKKERLSLTDYFEILTTQAQIHDIPLNNYPHLQKLNVLKATESKIDFKKAGQEQSLAIQALPESDQKELCDLAEKEKKPFRLSSGEHKEDRAFYTLLEEKLKSQKLPELSKYFAYLKEAKSLNPTKLLEEQKALETEIFNSLATRPDEVSLVRSSKNLEILKKLLNLTLTPEDWETYQKDKQSFDIKAMTGFLNKKIMDLHSYYDRAAFLEPGYEEIVQKAGEFYGLTYTRDQKFVENTLKKMDAENQTQAVLITGGFHSPNLKYLLKQKNISFVNLTPQVFQETNQARYEEILLGQMEKIRKYTQAPILKSGGLLASTAEVMRFAVPVAIEMKVPQDALNKLQFRYAQAAARLAGVSDDTVAWDALEQKGIGDTNAQLPMVPSLEKTSLTASSFVASEQGLVDEAVLKEMPPATLDERGASGARLSRVVRINEHGLTMRMDPAIPTLPVFIGYEASEDQIAFRGSALDRARELAETLKRWGWVTSAEVDGTKLLIETLGGRNLAPVGIDDPERLQDLLNRLDGDYRAEASRKLSPAVSAARLAIFTARSDDMSDKGLQNIIMMNIRELERGGSFTNNSEISLVDFYWGDTRVKGDSTAQLLENVDRMRRQAPRDIFTITVSPRNQAQGQGGMIHVMRGQLISSPEDTSSITQDKEITLVRGVGSDDKTIILTVWPVSDRTPSSGYKALGYSAGPGRLNMAWRKFIEVPESVSLLEASMRMMDAIDQAPKDQDLGPDQIDGLFKDLDFRSLPPKLIKPVWALIPFNEGRQTLEVGLSSNEQFSFIYSFEVKVRDLDGRVRPLKNVPADPSFSINPLTLSEAQSLIINPIINYLANNQRISDSGLYQMISALPSVTGRSARSSSLATQDPTAARLAMSRDQVLDSIESQLKELIRDVTLQTTFTFKFKNQTSGVERSVTYNYLPWAKPSAPGSPSEFRLLLEALIDADGQYAEPIVTLKDYAGEITISAAARLSLDQARTGYIEALRDYAQFMSDYPNGLLSMVGNPEAITTSRAKFKQVEQSRSSYLKALVDSGTKDRNILLEKIDEAVAEVNEISVIQAGMETGQADTAIDSVLADSAARLAAKGTRREFLQTVAGGLAALPLASVLRADEANQVPATKDHPKKFQDISRKAMDIPNPYQPYEDGAFRDKKDFLEDFKGKTAGDLKDAFLVFTLSPLDAKTFAGFTVQVRTQITGKNKDFLAVFRKRDGQWYLDTKEGASKKATLRVLEDNTIEAAVPGEEIIGFLGEKATLDQYHVKYGKSQENLDAKSVDMKTNRPTVRIAKPSAARLAGISEDQKYDDFRHQVALLHHASMIGELEQGAGAYAALIDQNHFPKAFRAEALGNLKLKEADLDKWLDETRSLFKKEQDRRAKDLPNNPITRTIVDVSLAKFLGENITSIDERVWLEAKRSLESRISVSEGDVKVFRIGQSLHIQVAHRKGDASPYIHQNIVNAVTDALKKASELALIRGNDVAEFAALSMPEKVRRLDISPTDMTRNVRGADTQLYAVFQNTDLHVVNQVVARLIAIVNGRGEQSLTSIEGIPGFRVTLRHLDDIRNSSGENVIVLDSAKDGRRLESALMSNEWVVTEVYPPSRETYPEGRANPLEPAIRINVDQPASGGKYLRRNITMMIASQSGLWGVGEVARAVTDASVTPGGEDGGRYVATVPVSLEQAVQTPAQDGIGYVTFYGYQVTESTLPHKAPRLPTTSDYIDYTPELYQQKMTDAHGALDFLRKHAGFPIETTDKKARQVAAATSLTLKDAESGQTYLRHIPDPKKGEDDAILDVANRRVQDANGLIRTVFKADVGGELGHTVSPWYYFLIGKAAAAIGIKNGLFVDAKMLYRGSPDMPFKDKLRFPGGAGDDVQFFAVHRKGLNAKEVHSFFMRTFLMMGVIAKWLGENPYGWLQDIVGEDVMSQISDDGKTINLRKLEDLAGIHTDEGRQILDIFAKDFRETIANVTSNPGGADNRVLEEHLQVLNAKYEQIRTAGLTAQAASSSDTKVSGPYSGNVQGQGPGWAETATLDPTDDVTTVHTDKTGPAFFNITSYYAAMEAYQNAEPGYENGIVFEVYDSIDHKRIFLDIADGRQQQILKKLLSDLHRYNVKRMFKKVTADIMPMRANLSTDELLKYVDPIYFFEASTERLSIITGGEYRGKDDAVATMSRIFNEKYFRKYALLTSTQGDARGSFMAIPRPSSLQDAVATDNSRPIQVMIDHTVDKNGKIVQSRDVFAQPEFAEIRRRVEEENRRIWNLTGVLPPVGPTPEKIEPSYPAVKTHVLITGELPTSMAEEIGQPILHAHGALSIYAKPYQDPWEAVYAAQVAAAARLAGVTDPSQLSINARSVYDNIFTNSMLLGKARAGTLTPKIYQDEIMKASAGVTFASSEGDAWVKDAFKELDYLLSPENLGERNTVKLTKDKFNTVSLDFEDNTSDSVVEGGLANGATEFTTNPFSIATSLVKGTDPALDELLKQAPANLRGRDLLKWIYWKRGQQIANHSKLRALFEESKGKHGWVSVEVDPTFAYLWEIKTTDNKTITPVSDERGIVIRREFQPILGDRVESLEALQKRLQPVAKDKEDAEAFKKRVAEANALKETLRDTLVGAMLEEAKQISSHASNIAVKIGNTRGLKTYLGEDLALSVGLRVLEEATALGISTNFTLIFGLDDGEANQRAWRRGYLRAKAKKLVSAERPVRGFNSYFVSRIEPYTLAKVDKSVLNYAQGVIGVLTTAMAYLKGFSGERSNDTDVDEDQSLIIASLANKLDGPKDLYMDPFIGGGERAVLTIPAGVINNFNEKDPATVQPNLGVARKVSGQLGLKEALIGLILPFFQKQMQSRLQPLYDKGYLAELKAGAISPNQAARRAVEEFLAFQNHPANKTMLDALSVEGDIKFALPFVQATAKVDATRAARLATVLTTVSDSDIQHLLSVVEKRLGLLAPADAQRLRPGLDRIRNATHSLDAAVSLEHLEDLNQAIEEVLAREAAQDTSARVLTLDKISFSPEEMFALIQARLLSLTRNDDRTWEVNVIVKGAVRDSSSPALRFYHDSNNVRLYLEQELTPGTLYLWPKFDTDKDAGEVTITITPKGLTSPTAARLANPNFYFNRLPLNVQDAQIRDTQRRAKSQTLVTLRANTASEAQAARLVVQNSVREASRLPQRVKERLDRSFALYAFDQDDTLTPARQHLLKETLDQLSSIAGSPQTQGSFFADVSSGDLNHLQTYVTRHLSGALLDRWYEVSSAGAQIIAPAQVSGADRQTLVTSPITNLKTDDLALLEAIIEETIDRFQLPRLEKGEVKWTINLRSGLDEVVSQAAEAIRTGISQSRISSLVETEGLNVQASSIAIDISLANKPQALQTVASHIAQRIGTSREEVLGSTLFIGDSLNDVDALNYVASKGEGSLAIFVGRIPPSNLSPDVIRLGPEFHNTRGVNAILEFHAAQLGQAGARLAPRSPRALDRAEGLTRGRDIATETDKRLSEREASGETNLNNDLVLVALENDKTHTPDGGNIAVVRPRENRTSVFNLRVLKGSDVVVVTEEGGVPVRLEVKKILTNKQGQSFAQVRTSDVINLVKAHDAGVLNAVAQITDIDNTISVNVSVDTRIFGDIKTQTGPFDVFALQFRQAVLGKKDLRDVTFSFEGPNQVLAAARLSQLDKTYGLNGSMPFVKEASNAARIIHLGLADLPGRSQSGHRYLPIQPAKEGDAVSYGGTIPLAVAAARIAISPDKPIDDHFGEAFERALGHRIENRSATLKQLLLDPTLVTLRVQNALRALTKIVAESVSQFYRNMLALARAA